MKPLVSADWLFHNLHDPELVLLDASIPKVGDTELGNLAEIQIPGSRFFDLNGVFSDHATDLPHTLPSPENFAEGCQQLGIDSASKLVVYDRHGVYSSPRVWWMFRAMGHADVAVLDGGLPSWKEAGHALEAKAKSLYPIGDFAACFEADMVCNAEWVLGNLNTSRVKILDARSKGRFCGELPEPRVGLRCGHIPGAINLPFDQVLGDGKFLPLRELEKLFNELQLGDSELVFTCGSGVTACIILLACELVLANRKRVYDGSWAEWGKSDSGFPIE